MVQPLWKTVGIFLKKIKKELPYDPANPFLGIYPDNTTIQKDTCTATPSPRSSSCAGSGAAKRSYSTFKVRRGGHKEIPLHARQGAAAALCWSSREEIPHIQGKRNPSKTVGVARGHQRADRLKPQSQKTSQSDHRTTALSNAVKLSHAVWGHP